MSPLLRPIWPLSGALCLAAGCGGSSGTTTPIPRPTLVEVFPGEFLGDVSCLDAPGALRVYVATLIEVVCPDPVVDESDLDPPRGPLPSSGPVSCYQPVGFGSVEPGRCYDADIQGYDRDDLIARAPGQPELVERATRESVAPRWTTHCGDDRTPAATAETQLTRRVHGCGPFAADGLSPTGVAVDPSAALGSLECSAIDHFEVKQGGESLGEIGCGESLLLEDRTPGEHLELEVLAFESPDAEAPSYGTTCSATAQAGVIVPATCDRLSDRGAVAVSLTLALTSVGMSCSASLDLLTLTLVDGGREPLRFDAEACQGTAQFSDLTPGSYSIEVEALGASDGTPARASCTAEVEPGLVALASCGPG